MDTILLGSIYPQEVICSFGRLGTMFGFDKYNIKPDLVAIAKALSSAYMPIGAVLVSPDVSANSVYKLASVLLGVVFILFMNLCPLFKIQGSGLIIGTELVSNKSPHDPFPTEWGIGEYFCAQCEENGMLVHVAGDNIMMAPSLIITPEEIDQIISLYGKALKVTEERVKELKSKQK